MFHASQIAGLSRVMIFHDAMEDQKDWEWLIANRPDLVSQVAAGGVLVSLTEDDANRILNEIQSALAAREKGK